MEEDRLFENIRNIVASDLEPVRPLAPNWRRASTLLFLWPFLVGIVLAVFGLRHDYYVLGPWMACVLPFLEALAAYGIVIFGLRLAIPGSLVSWAFTAFLVAAASLAHLIIAGVMFHFSPTHVEPGAALRMTFTCFAITLFLGLIPLAFILNISRKGFPMRPKALGFLSGLASGLAAESAWRFHCPFNSWAHILTSHSTAVLATALIGGFLGYCWEKRHIRAIYSGT
jgi:hypothetical protein